MWHPGKHVLSEKPNEIVCNRGQIIGSNNPVLVVFRDHPAFFIVSGAENRRSWRKSGDRPFPSILDHHRLGKCAWKKSVEQQISLFELINLELMQNNKVGRTSFGGRGSGPDRVLIFSKPTWLGWRKSRQYLLFQAVRYFWMASEPQSCFSLPTCQPGSLCRENCRIYRN